MSDGPWFKFFPSDWRGGVAKLSAAERGVYISLIVAMYDSGGPIRRDDGRLARECGLPKAGFVRALDALIAEGKIEFDGQCLSNSRTKHELTEREKRSVSARAGASVTNEKRRAKSNGVSRDSERGAYANGVAVGAQNERHTRSQSPDKESANADSSQRVADAPGKSRSKRTTGAEVETILLEILTPATTADLIAHRKAKREPLTERAARIAVEEMRRHGDPEACAREWILRGWRGFKADWMPDARSASGPSVTSRVVHIEKTGTFTRIAMERGYVEPAFNGRSNGEAAGNQQKTLDLDRLDFERRGEGQPGADHHPRESTYAGNQGRPAGSAGDFATGLVADLAGRRA